MSSSSPSPATAVPANVVPASAVTASRHRVPEHRRAEVTGDERRGGRCACCRHAELAPIAAVGGLAQAAAGLVAELRRLDIDVTVVMPDGGIELADERIDELAVPAVGQPGPPAQWRACRRRATQRRRSAGAGSEASVPAARRPRMAGQRPSVPLVLPGDRRRRRGDPARGRPPQRLAHRRHARCRRRVDPHRPVAAQHRLPGIHRRGVAAYLGLRGATTSGSAGPNPLSGAIALADAIVAVSPTHARRSSPRRAGSVSARRCATVGPPSGGSSTASTRRCGTRRRTPHSSPTTRRGRVPPSGRWPGPPTAPPSASAPGSRTTTCRWR